MKRSEKSEHKNRLDVEMVSRGLTRSRSLASDLISRGKVNVNGVSITKPHHHISPSDIISVSSMPAFVSRAGEKLDHAIDHFKLNLEGKQAIDIGSSTGGFTDCLIQHGVKKVIAVDVGVEQISPKLRSLPNVEIHEGVDIRKFSMIEPVDMAVADVSFISLSMLLSKIYGFLRKGGYAVVLVKPQFEVGMDIAKRYHGVIRDENLQKLATEKIKADATEAGFRFIDETPSPITGEKGNREFLLLFQK